MTSSSTAAESAAFAASYECALLAHLSEPGEETLSEAYELGRGALGAEMSVLDVAAAHHASLLEALRREPDRSRLARMSGEAAAFFIESLSSYEVTQRGLREAQQSARLEHAHAMALNGLAEAAVALNAVREVDRLLDLVCGIARELIGADCASIEITPDRGAPLSTRSLAGRYADWTPEGSLSESSDIVVSALASGRPTRLSAERLAELRVLEDGRPALRGWLGVPLRAREGARQLGLLEVADKTGGEFSANDEAIIVQLAQMAAVALENLWLYEREHQIAFALQESLLPRELPEIAGLELAARYRAAGDGNEVGGDFYDVVEVGSGRWLLIIGDVCGKGAQAAAITGLARHTIRSVARRERAPEAILTALNEALLADAPGTQFCTVACALVEVSARDSGSGPRVRLANAGHPRPLLRRVDGRTEPVGPSGTLLGFVEDPRMAAEELVLGPGEALIFYTDGVTDAQAPERSWTPEQLADAIAFAGSAEAEALVDRVEAAAVPDDVVARDDIAILVLRARE